MASRRASGAKARRNGWPFGRKAVPLLTALEGWLREKQKTLSRHSELSKAFAYALNQWDALKLYLREITDTEHAGNVPPLTQ